VGRKGGTRRKPHLLIERAIYAADPRPLPPGRIIADVMPVSAIKFSDPVTFNVDMVADDFLLHANA
jgi:hypothetical protein